MARNLKQIAHDLIPLSDAATELSAVISELLSGVKPFAQFDNAKAAASFNDCTKAAQKLAISTKLIKEYVQQVNSEADRENIFKDS